MSAMLFIQYKMHIDNYDDRVASLPTRSWCIFLRYLIDIIASNQNISKDIAAIQLVLVMDAR